MSTTQIDVEGEFTVPFVDDDDYHHCDVTVKASDSTEAIMYARDSIDDDGLLVGQEYFREYPKATRP